MSEIYYLLRNKHDEHCEPYQIQVRKFAFIEVGPDYEQIELVPKSELEAANAEIERCKEIAERDAKDYSELKAENESLKKRLLDFEGMKLTNIVD